MSRTGAIVASAIVIALGAFVFTRTAIHALVSAPDSVGPPPASVPAALADAPQALPARLIIPSIGVDAAVQDVGVNKQGNMRAPSDFTDVAWYEYGTVPGERGSAVIAGHFDNGLGLAGVFKKLGMLRVGDDIYVETASSTRLHFLVEATSSYPYQGVPADLLFTRADTVRLNLITCDGAFLPVSRTYDRRLVVYATRAPD